MIDLAKLNSYFPILIFALSGITLVSKRPDEQSKFPTWMYLFLMLAFLQPWYILNAFQQTDFWLYSIQALVALILIVARRTGVSEEAWLKAAVSLCVGVLFLFVFQYPTLGIPFQVSGLWEKAIVVSALIVSIFLLFGLPPLQLGALDLGSERMIRLQVPVTLAFRFVIAYYLLSSVQSVTWFISYIDYEPLIVGVILFGLALAHITLRLQTNVYRLLSYLFSSLVLAIVVEFTYPDFAPLVLVGLIVVSMPFVMLLNIPPPDKSDGLDIWNVTNYYRCHPLSAKQFFQWLKVFLWLEAGMGVAVLYKLGYEGNYLAALSALVFICSVFSVLWDRQAFVARADH